MSTASQLANDARIQMRSIRERAEAMINNAKAENRELTADERTRQDALLSEYKTTREKRDTYLGIDTEERAIDALLAQPTIPGATREKSDRTATVSVGREARTYRPDNDPNGALFIRDLIDDFMGRGRGESAQRIDRHVQETRVENANLMERSSAGIGTSAVSGLVVPQYLTDMVAPATANLRPYANNAFRHELPKEGMSVNISRITTPSSAALQTTELSAVSFTDMDDTILSVPVLTAAGQQLVSRQALERGAGVEDTVVSDLLRRIAVVVDSTMLNQAVTGALATAGNTVYTSAAPTQVEMFPNFYKAQSALETTLRGVANVDACFMTPARWNWYSSALTTQFPLVNNGQGSGFQSGTVKSLVYNDGVRGTLPNGLPVYVDANIPSNVGGATNEDRIIFASSAEVHLWEDAQQPVVIRAEQPSVASLGVNLVAYQFLAFTHGRYANNPQVMSGTGMITTTVLAGF